MKVYLDNSVLNRPFDNLEIPQNKLESEVLFWIVNLVKEEKILLVNSAVIKYENSLNPFLERKIFVENIVKLAKIFQNLNKEIYLRAKEIRRKFKIPKIDALHLATAEFSQVDYFITCDYNLIKRSRGKLKVISSLKFLQEYEKSNP